MLGLNWFMLVKWASRKVPYRCSQMEKLKNNDPMASLLPYVEYNCDFENIPDINICHILCVIPYPLYCWHYIFSSDRITVIRRNCNESDHSNNCNLKRYAKHASHHHLILASLSRLIVWVISVSMGLSVGLSNVCLKCEHFYSAPQKIPKFGTVLFHINTENIRFPKF